MSAFNKGNPQFFENAWTLSNNNVLYVVVRNTQATHNTNQGKSMHCVGQVGAVNFSSVYADQHNTPTPSFALSTRGASSEVVTVYILKEASYFHGSSKGKFVPAPAEEVRKYQASCKQAGQWLKTLMKSQKQTGVSGEVVEEDMVNISINSSSSEPPHPKGPWNPIPDESQDVDAEEAYADNSQQSPVFKVTHSHLGKRTAAQINASAAHIQPPPQQTIQPLQKTKPPNTAYYNNTSSSSSSSQQSSTSSHTPYYRTSNRSNPPAPRPSAADTTTTTTTSTTGTHITCTFDL